LEDFGIVRISAVIAGEFHQPLLSVFCTELFFAQGTEYYPLGDPIVQACGHRGDFLGHWRNDLGTVFHG
jgi:hypothetical protein